MKKKNVKSPLLLFLAAVIWGAAFVAQSIGMEYVGPFTFNAIRSILGGLVLLPVIAVTGRVWDKEALRGGFCCGLCLFIASNLQQIGIKYTTVGKAGFITAMYIVIVPVLGIFLKKHAGIKVCISVGLAVIGLYLLCMTESISLGRGDAYVLLCAFAFSLHILVIDYFAPRADGVIVSCIQFFVCGILSGLFMIFLEKPQIHSVMSAWLPLAYAGVMSCGVAYTFQIIGQKDMNPTVASLILSLESVVSVLAGWIILHQKLSFRERVGCIVMFGAIILAQLPDKVREQDAKSDDISAK